MSNIRDEQLLDEYLSGNTPYSSHYRELPVDDVPPELDAVVLSQAKQAVKVVPLRALGKWRRWSVPTTLAATFVLAVQAHRQRSEIRVIEQEVPSTRKAVVA